MPIQGQRPRVLGGGVSVFTWDNGSGAEVIAFADTIAVQAVTPVAQAEVIQPMNATRPAEIVTPTAHTNGVITLTLTELYNQAVWQRFAGLVNSNDIVDIMTYIAGLPKGITITRFVTPPSGIGPAYNESFYECSVVEMQDDESIAYNTMTVNKTMTLWYTYNVKHWISSPRKVADVFTT